MINYTEEQIEAIKPQGSLVITACPGSGKTAVIAEKIRNELAELKSYQGIIAITFTRKASKELEGRCRVNGADTKCSFFGTIDSFCLSEIIYPFLNQIFDGNTADLEPKYESDLTLAETSIATQLNDIDKVEAEELELIRKLYLSDTIYFPTIPALAMYIHENCAACRTYIKAKYTSIYIDEYQDSSKAQHNLFLSIVDSGLTGIAVGDLQQSIYGWRRCSPEYLKELIRRHDFTHRTVSYNHRCHASISNYSNRLFNPQFELTPTDSIQVWQCQFTGTQRDAASHLNTIIPSILDKNLRDHLTIPCRIFADDPIDELQSRTGFLWSALLKYRFDISTNPDQIIEILPDHSNTSRAKLIDIRRTIRKARSVDQPFLESYLASTSKKLLNIEPKDSELAALKIVASDIDSLKQYTITTTNEIQCMTIHKAKGLEFEIVIHLDLNEWLFPYRVIGESFSDKLYPSWEQDLNLHFVGVTRAKTMCLLVHTTQRLNAKDETKSGEPSAFLRLPGVQTLYKTYSSPK
jgi:DNA helicase-2/ATP-dependent DNA helicase PcrA